MENNEYLEMAVIHMLSQKEILELLSNNLNTWKEKYGIKRIALFGSYSRGEQKDSSDIDLLVEFADNSMTFDNYMELKFDLEDLSFSARRLHLICVTGEAQPFRWR
jgi:predicted nucleotidyltransferase